MADSLLKGRGLEVHYITYFFRKYPRCIVRPEDHWPPFYGFLIAPCFACLGRTAFAAKLPSLLISCFGLPAITYALSRQVVRSRAVAFMAAVSVLLYLPLVSWSLECLSDVTFAFLVTAAVLCAVRGASTDGRWFYLMGLLLACAYYAKGNALVLVPAFAVYYLWRRRLNQAVRPRARALTDTHFVGGLGLLVLLLVPWFVRNTVYFGNPLFSTQNHVAGYIGWQDWEDGSYALYWGKKVPSVADKLAHPAHLAVSSRQFAKQALWWLFIRQRTPWSVFKFAFKDISTWMVGFPALLGLGAVVLAAGRALARRDLRAAMRPEYGLFILVGLSHLTFLAVCWQPIDRLNAPAIPLMMLAGWATVWALARSLLGWTGVSRTAAAACVLALGAVWARHEWHELRLSRAQADYPWRENGEGWMAAGRWLKANAPGSVTMTRNPWELHFYSQENAVQIPLGQLDQVLAVARYYGATHLIPDGRRPNLEPWLKGQVPGLRKVFAAYDVELYEIDPRSVREKGSQQHVSNAD
jgi:4-amino-4-deoxy-L-arabinose transferase-like glycosyltransferase